MALFEISSQDKSDISSWLEGVHSEIDTKAKHKCKIYNFDFFQGLPYEKSTNFEWVSSDTNNEYERDPSTRASIRPSRNSYQDDPEQILEIPDLFVNTSDIRMDRL